MFKENPANNTYQRAARRPLPPFAPPRTPQHLISLTSIEDDALGETL
jgi:hypothetical protein